MKAEGGGDAAIASVAELELRGAKDDVLFGVLRQRDYAALVTMDSSMLSASVRSEAWRASGVSAFLFENRWNDLTRFEKARGLLWWWPIILRQVQEGPQGGAWKLPLDMRAGGMQRLLAEGADATAG